MFKYVAFICLLSSFSFVSPEKKEDTSIYTGTYHFPAGNNIPEVIVNAEKKQLTIIGVFGSSFLIPSKIKDRFTLSDYEGNVEFLRNSSHKTISKIHLTLYDVPFDAEGDKIDFNDYGVKE